MAPLWKLPTVDQILAFKAPKGNARHRSQDLDEYRSLEYHEDVFVIFVEVGGFLCPSSLLGDEWFFHSEAEASACAAIRGYGILPLNGKTAHDRATRGAKLRAAEAPAGKAVAALLPCPFCSGMPLEGQNIIDQQTAIVCSQCGARIEDPEGDIDAVRRAWNRRV